MMHQKAIPIFQPPHTGETISQPCHVFFLGTGRCGTQTLARMISELEGCRVVHEHKPALLDEVTDYLNGRLSRTQIVELLRRTRNVKVLGGCRVSGESNQRLSFLLPELAAAWPEARLVWLLRDGREVVTSIFHRHWYHPREALLREHHHAPSARNRLRADTVGDMSTEQWCSLTPFERCCWYWSYTNRTIESQLAQLDQPWLRLRLEDLDQQMPHLMAFLGLEQTSLESPVANRARHGQPLPATRWSPAQAAQFERLAGAAMDRYYPNWRQDWNPGAGRGPLPAAARLRYRSSQSVRTFMIMLAKAFGRC